MCRSRSVLLSYAKSENFGICRIFVLVWFCTRRARRTWFGKAFLPLKISSVDYIEGYITDCEKQAALLVSKAAVIDSGIKYQLQV
jgi:hypothetical protein